MSKSDGTLLKTSQIQNCLVNVPGESGKLAPAGIGPLEVVPAVAAGWQSEIVAGWAGTGWPAGLSAAEAVGTVAAGPPENILTGFFLSIWNQTQVQISV